MKQESSPISFILQKVTTEQFAIIGDSNEEKKNIRLGTNLRFAADQKQRLVAVFAHFIFDSNEKPFIVIEAGCHFEIKKGNWEKMVDKENRQITIPHGLMSHFAMLTVGTCRGILHAKTETTCFNKFVIPTINVADMIKEDVIFDFSK